ncbi:MAG: DUF2806 domain-containing protein [Gammaproteobacteria bacterium]|nr:DUF2806 domain-containing protein [Gammaproteobacteria bacterium]
MQLLWFSLLVGEANQHGSFSNRTINFVGSMDKKEAGLFTDLCQFAWELEDEDSMMLLMYRASCEAKVGLEVS